MFYTQTIQIVQPAYSTGGFGSSKPVVHFPEKLLATHKADVQPVLNQAEYFQYGYTQNIEFKIFCDRDDLIILGATIKYKGVNYKVIKALDWGNYMEVLINKL